MRSCRRLRPRDRKRGKAQAAAGAVGVLDRRRCARELGDVGRSKAILRARASDSRCWATSNARAQATSNGGEHPKRAWGVVFTDQRMLKSRAAAVFDVSRVLDSRELAIHLAPLNVVRCRGKVSGGLTSREEGRAGVRVGGERSLDQTVEEQAAVA